MFFYFWKVAENLAESMMNLATSDAGVKVTLQTVEDELDLDNNSLAEEPTQHTEPTVLVHAQGDGGAVRQAEQPQEQELAGVEVKSEGQ